MQGTRVESLGWKDPLEKGTVTHSSIQAWRIPWTVQSMGLQRVGHTEQLSLYFMFSLPGGASGKEPTYQCRRHKRCGFYHWVWKIPQRRVQQPTPGFLPGESHGQEEPGRLQSLRSQSQTQLKLFSAQHTHYSIHCHSTQVSWRCQCCGQEQQIPHPHISLPHCPAPNLAGGSKYSLLSMKLNLLSLSLDGTAVLFSLYPSVLTTRNVYISIKGMPI